MKANVVAERVRQKVDWQGAFYHSQTRLLMVTGGVKQQTLK